MTGLPVVEGVPEKHIKTMFGGPTPSQADVTFPANAMRYYVAMAEIPERFKNGDEFSRWGSKLFFQGGTLPKESLREGLDFADVMRRLRVMLGTFESKHEHKEAAVGYFLSIAFKEIPK